MMKQAKNCIRKRLNGISVEENRISCFIGLLTVGNVSNVRAGIKPNNMERGIVSEPVDLSDF